MTALRPRFQAIACSGMSECVFCWCDNCHPSFATSTSCDPKATMTHPPRDSGVAIQRQSLVYTDKTLTLLHDSRFAFGLLTTLPIIQVGQPSSSSKSRRNLSTLLRQTHHETYPTFLPIILSIIENQRPPYYLRRSTRQGSVWIFMPTCST